MGILAPHCNYLDANWLPPVRWSRTFVHVSCICQKSSAPRNPVHVALLLVDQLDIGTVPVYTSPVSLDVASKMR